MLGPLLDVQVSLGVAGARDSAPSQEWAKREGFVAVPKTLAGVGHLKGICKNTFCVASAVQETCSSELLGGPGADFLRGVAFWSVRSSVLGRWLGDRCSTSYDLASLLRCRRSTSMYFRQVEWKNRIGTRPLALHSTFHVWRESRRIALFLMLTTPRIASFLTLSSWKTAEVLQTCFFFDAVKVNNWGSLAE